MDTLKWISAYNFIEDDGYIYLSNRFYNGLFKIEIKSGKTIFLGRFEGEKLCGNNIHIEAFQKKHKIYFCPKRGKNVHIYNIGDQSIEVIGIRKNYEEFFTIKDVILTKNFVFFIPREKRFSIRRLDLDSQKVVEVDWKTEIQGEYLSEYRKIFPYNELIEKYDIRDRERFFWNQVREKEWYGFLPSGCQLLQYVEGMNKIKEIPLVIENEAILEKYLQKVKEAFLKESFIAERRLGIQGLLNCLETEGISKRDIFDNSSIGEIIWKTMKK